MQTDLSNAVLGDTRGMIPVQDLQDFQTGVQALARQVQRSVKIFSQSLDHELYDLEGFHDSLSETITGRGKLRVNILIKSTEGLMTKGHRLLTLVNRLPSFVAIHRFPDEARTDKEEYVLFDDIGIIKRYPRTEVKGYYEFRTADAAVKARHFDALWARSEPCRELQHVRI